MLYRDPYYAQSAIEFEFAVPSSAPAAPIPLRPFLLVLSCACALILTLALVAHSLT
jgi:hypothetical protein